MAYANSLPPIAIKICRGFNVFCFSATMLMCLDLFILPRAVDSERILAIEENYITSRNITYTRTTKRLENVGLITENFRVPFRATVYMLLEQADSVKVVRTPLLGIIESGTVKVPGRDEDIVHTAGIFGKLMYIPIAFALTAFVGIIMWNNKEQLLNAAIVNIFMLLLLLVTFYFF